MRELTTKEKKEVILGSFLILIPIGLSIIIIMLCPDKDIKYGTLCIPLPAFSYVLCFSLFLTFTLFIVSKIFHESRKKLILPAILTLLVLNCSFLIYLYIYISNIALHNMRTSNAVGMTQNLLNLLSILIGVAAFAATIWGLWIQYHIQKISELETKTKQVTKLTVLSAENVIANIPDLSKSQQIPEQIVSTLTVLINNVFHDQDRTIINYLDDTGNGVMLRFARALYFFGRANFEHAERILQEEVIAKCDNDRSLRLKAKYRLGICQRQRGYYPQSIETFMGLYSDAGANTEWQDMSKLGTGLTLLAMGKNGGQFPINGIIIAKGICKADMEVRIENRPHLLRCAYDIFNELHKSENSIPMFQAYFVASAFITGHKDGIEDVLKELVTFISKETMEYNYGNFKLRANYFATLGKVYVCYNEVTNAQNAFNAAIKNAKIYEQQIIEEHYHGHIYSEETLSEIPIEQFVNEMEKEKATASRSSWFLA